MLTDLPIGWLIVSVAVIAASAAIIVLTIAFIVPEVWREGLIQMRLWLTPDKPEPRDPQEERRLRTVVSIGDRR